MTYRQSQSRTQHHNRHNDRRDLPRHTDMFTLMTLGPEQIEEERRTEDKRDRDSNEDIIRGGADEAVIVDFDARVLALDFALLVEVVCKGWLVHSLGSMGWLGLDKTNLKKRQFRRIPNTRRGS